MCVQRVYLCTANMFQISPLYHTPTFMTRMSSPLAPRNPNACPRFPYQMASSEEKIYDRSLHPQKRLPQKPYQQRRPEEEQERRRGAFLTKVRQSSDDRRWESRSEQVGRNLMAYDKRTHCTKAALDPTKRFPVAAEAVGTRTSAFSPGRALDSGGRGDGDGPGC